ncbi:MBL fold metallo-hydrolase [Shewanella psychropiezotolerans]|uniref:MBL fold metallo-hydrolase n=1 Tax=Shewanella psychropiezotolerans TaxID=2593655 RepID=A0ABX5X0S0_9GAMM|nr:MULTISPECIES: alkyl sulfatase dimerization domain-containing protein [Shewanella]MPY23231.1 MBL fold metallo-hydrolase [Shewanella sp. YLB-07]QDO82851.1 MBL fold metallo-hydrolase [Shewanella psychropiezotolerans]
MNRSKLALLVAFSLVLPHSSLAATQSKPASQYTKVANAAVLKALPFSDRQDFEDAQRGFIAKPDTVTIKDSQGNVVWDLEQYKTYISIDKDAPDTVNPSLWRNAQLVIQHGLFKVTDNIYQVRGFDLSNITFIKGKTGWIVFDPLISPETAKAALDFINEQLGERPVVAIIYSHSHIDHYGGATGIATTEQVASGEVQIISPEHFTEHAVSENVIAGNAMGRRAIYMYGAMLPRNAKGGVNGGLGMTVSTGLAGLLLPSHEITKTGEKLSIDGINMEFQLTPGSEAPAEMNTWFPDMKALWMAENSTNTMHNILTLRGAEVRDALIWANFLDETIDTWGSQAKVKFQSHHWPVWDTENIIPYFKKQRDIYKFTHDQSVRLMNQGYTGEEISEIITLPAELEQNWPTRGYYGTLRHNSRAVYQKYMGWYNGNPSNLNNLPPEMVATKYMDFMGGEAAVIKKSQASFDKGEYRWVAEVMKHAVFANPKSRPAKELLADAFEQLGYQAESGPWRSVYLQGAYELRNGVPSAGGTQTATPDTIRAMTPDMLFDFLAVRLDSAKAAGKVFDINIDFTDLKSKYTLTIENAVLHHSQNQVAKPDVALVMSMNTMNSIQLKEFTFDEAIKNGSVKISGDKKQFNEFLGMLDDFNFWFNIVTP